jgi:hypothetical protein
MTSILPPLGPDCPHPNASAYNLGIYTVHQSPEVLIHCAGWQPATFLAQESLARPGFAVPSRLPTDLTLPGFIRPVLPKRITVDRIDTPSMLHGARLRGGGGL